uniref:Lipocln_cytosolic_FA-bd_dom domain-containing protein n=1 Tax=Rhodnius prolixus TaxID=13249 RepID=T1HJM8_RHOPR
MSHFLPSTHSFRIITMLIQVLLKKIVISKVSIQNTNPGKKRGTKGKIVNPNPMCARTPIFARLVTEMLLLLILSIWVDTSSSQVPYLGSCPDLKTVDNFDQTRYMGKWYEAERYFSLFEFGGKCINSNYTDGIDSINIISKQTSTLTGIHSTIEGEVQKTPNGFLSKMNLKYPYLPMDAPYWILDTDYDNYSVVWSCSNFGLFST